MNEYEIDNLLEQVEEAESCLKSGIKSMAAALDCLSHAEEDFVDVSQLCAEIRSYLNYEREE